MTHYNYQSSAKTYFLKLHLNLSVRFVQTDAVLATWMSQRSATVSIACVSGSLVAVTALIVAYYACEYIILHMHV